MIGIDLEKNPFREPIRDRIEAARPQLRLRNRVLFNEQSHPDFGWQLRDQFKDWELGKQAVTIVGGFPMLRGFAADSSVICSDQNFLRLCRFPPGRTSFGFLKVVPGAEPATLERLKTQLPPDVEPFSREQILAREIDHWVNQTSTGQLFAFGVLVAMIVADGGRLPGPLQRRPRAPARVRDPQGHGLLVPQAGGRRGGPVDHLHADLLRDCRDPRPHRLPGDRGAGRASPCG